MNVRKPVRHNNQMKKIELQRHQQTFLRPNKNLGQRNPGERICGWKIAVWAIVIRNSWMV